LSKKASTDYYALKPILFMEAEVVNLLKLKFFVVLFSGVLFAFSTAAQAQDLSFQYFYRVEMSGAHEPPTFPNGFPEFVFPDEARKNGVEGTLKISLTLGEDGKAKDIVVGEPLPHGVSESLTKSLQTLRFRPAQNDGKPVAVKMFFEYVVAATYGETDKNVSKPKITAQPAAVYPEKHRAGKVKGKVAVSAIFYPDGKLKIVRVASVLPKEFDRAAAEAAQNIKFTPAVHKKSKKPVARQFTVEYEFKF
jgi:TonB family protein